MIADCKQQESGNLQRNFFASGANDRPQVVLLRSRSIRANAEVSGTNYTVAYAPG
jgi:hypothetical protein